MKSRNERYEEPADTEEAYEGDEAYEGEEYGEYEEYEEYEPEIEDYEEEYRERPRRSATRRGRRAPSATASADRQRKRRRAIIIFVIEIIVLLVLLFIVWTLFGRMNVDKVGKVNLSEEKITESIDVAVAENEEMVGYTNIALFGVDARNGALDKGTRSDTIIIASINNATKEIHLVSVYRDTYLNLSNDKYNKCNSAYAKGGPEQAISMLNMNMDMDIRDFITIGFSGLTDVINELGGVTVTVEEGEIDNLNNYQISMVGKKNGTNAAGEDSFSATPGVDYIPVTTAGTQTLNGLQATAYCRIRYGGGDDFRRAARQRTVLEACLNKAKTASPSQLENIAGRVFSETYTSLELSEIVKLLGDVPQYKVVGSDGFPCEELRGTGKIPDKGACVVPMDLSANVKWLHGFLFGDDGYEVTDNVRRYSDKIAADSAGYVD